MTELSKQQLLGKADNAAYRHLRQKYNTEFNEAKAKAAAELGVDWSPKPSKAEKDRALLVQILNENPDLKSQLAAELSVQPEAF